MIPSNHYQRTTLLTACLAVMRRECRLMIRSPLDSANALFFFLILMVVTGILFEHTPQGFQTHAPLLIWFSALLAQLLGVESIFKREHQIGSLHEYLLTPHPSALLIFSKLFMQQCFLLIPLLILTFVWATLADLPHIVVGVLLLSLGLGFPLFFFIGSIGAALTLGLRASYLLSALVLLPFYIPVLIFGLLAVTYAAGGLPWWPPILLLAAGVLIILPVAPMVSAALLRITVE